MMMGQPPARIRRVFTDEEIERLEAAAIQVLGFDADLSDSYQYVELVDGLIHVAMAHDPSFHDAVVEAHQTFHPASVEHAEGSPEREALLDHHVEVTEPELARFQSGDPIAAWALSVASLMYDHMNDLEEDVATSR